MGVVINIHEWHVYSKCFLKAGSYCMAAVGLVLEVAEALWYLAPWRRGVWPLTLYKRAAPGGTRGGSIDS